MLHPEIAAERRAVLATLAASAERINAILPSIGGHDDIEALHHFRVELRRVRTVLSALQCGLPVADCCVLTEECRWLAGRGSDLRDADVLFQRLPEYIDQDASTTSALRTLLGAIGRARSRARRQVRAALHSRRAAKLIERIGEVAVLDPVRPGWSALPDVARAVRKALRRMRAQGRAIDAQSPPEALHELRKRCKRLRYVLETYRDTLPAGEGDRILRRLRKLQTVLGDYQDFATHARMLAEVRADLPASDISALTLLDRVDTRLQELAEQARVQALARFAEFDAGKPRRLLARLLAKRVALTRPVVGTGGYCHGFATGERSRLPVGKIVCVGRNYAAHAAELGNPVPERPLLFIKPPSAAVDFAPFLRIPTDAGSAHHEIEIALLIGRELCHATPAEARAAIAGVALAIDLTLRDLQDELKAARHPWEIAKGFDGACALGPFVPVSPELDLAALDVRLAVNGRRRQAGSSAQMLTPIVELLCFASRQFSLWPGDVLLSGTPAGVAALKAGDRLSAELVGLSRLRSVVTA